MAMSVEAEEGCFLEEMKISSILVSMFFLVDSFCLKYMLVNCLLEDRFLGHLNHSGDLLLCVGVYHRPSCFMH